MTNIVFPSSPTTGQTFIAPTGVVYFYDGVKWVAQGQGGGGLPNGAVGTLQFNVGNGQLGGSSNLTTDGTNLSVLGNIVTGSILGNGQVNITANPSDNLTWSFGDLGSNIGALVAPTSDDANIGFLFFPGSNGAGFVTWSNSANIDPISANTLLVGSTNSVTIGTGALGNSFAGNTQWIFDIAGNLTLPSNTSSINYANGQPYGGSGGTANTGNITFDQANISTNIANGALQLLANGVGNVNVTTDTGTWRFNTNGNLDALDNLTIDSGYNSGNAGLVAVSGVSLRNTMLYASGNVATELFLNRPGTITPGDHFAQIALYEDNANTPLTWTFDHTGNLTVPGNIGAQGNVFANAIILKNTDDFAQIVFSSDGGTTNNGYIKVDGGTNMVIRSIANWYVSRNGQDKIAVTDTTSDFNAATNVRIQSNRTGSAYTWTFDNTGNLIAPGNISIAGNVNAGTITGNLYGNLLSTNGNYAGFDQFGDFVLPSSTYFGQSTNFGLAIQTSTQGATLAAPQTNQNLIFQTSNTGPNYHNWILDNTGNLTLPGNTFAVNYANGSPVTFSSSTGNIGFVGDAIYDTNGIILENAGLGSPAATAALIIPANANAGPVQLNNLAGNVTVNANTSSWTFGTDGNLTLPGNTSSINYANGSPYGGSGSSYGNSDVTALLSDFGGNTISTTGTVIVGTIETANLYIGPGPGGGSFILANANTGLVSLAQGSNGGAYLGWTEEFLTATGNVATIGFNPNGSGQGNVVISTGPQASPAAWTFDNTSNLVLPRGGVVYETNIPYGGLPGNTIALAPSGSSNVNQQLLVYPTVVEGNHLHLTTGNLYSTELFLGNDDLYVKLANTGNIIINSYDLANSVGKTWKFDNTGELTTPQGGRLGAAGKGWTGLDGGNGNPVSLTSLYSSGMYSSCITLNPDGTLNISTYGDGTGQVGNWNFSNANITTTGDSTISATVAGSGSYGNSISIVAGAADQSSFSTSPGGNLNLVGGLGASNDGGGGGQGGNVNITAGLSADPAGVAGNIVLTSGTDVWTFGNNGNITVPASSVIVPVSGTVGLSTPDGNTLAYVDANGFYIDTLYNTSEFEWHFDNSGNLSTPGAISATGNVTATNFSTSGSGGNITGANIFGGNLSLSGTVTSDVSVGGNISASGAITASSLTTNIIGGGVFVDGGDISVNQITGSGGNISAFGTITGANINGTNLSLSGNIFSANVTGNISASNISAGNISLSGNIFAYGGNIYSNNGLTMEGGDLTLANITGNGGNISASGTITGANINGANLSLSGNIFSANVTGNVSAANLSTGNISLTGNIFTYGANIYGVNGIRMEGGDLNIANITGTGGNISISGNITAANLPLTAKSGYNAFQPSIRLGTIQAAIDNAGNPTIAALTGTISSSYSGIFTQWNGSHYLSNPIGSNAITWTSLYGVGVGATFANAGETVVLNINDDTNNHLYQVTWAAGVSGPSTGYGFIQIQQLI